MMSHIITFAVLDKDTVIFFGGETSDTKEVMSLMMLVWLEKKKPEQKKKTWNFTVN